MKKSMNNGAHIVSKPTIDILFEYLANIWKVHLDTVFVFVGLEIHFTEFPRFL